MEWTTSQNAQAWEEVYRTTEFGNQYPTDGLISLYHHFMKQELAVLGRRVKVLDFGCSHGANAKYFADLGFDVYGIDISKKAVDYCIRKQGFDSRKFAACDVLKEEGLIRNMFGTFDLVIALECLFYFSKKDLDKLLLEFYDCMNEDAIIYTNMHNWNHQLYRPYRDAGVDEEGFANILTSGVADLPLHVRIVEDKNEVRSIFSRFREIKTVRSVLELESECETIHFIGKKKSEQNHL